MRPWRVPNWTAERAAVDSNIRPQGPWTVAITAVQEVAELDAVRVIFAQGLQQQLSTMTHGMLGGVHQHIRSWKEQKKRHQLFIVFSFMGQHSTPYTFPYTLSFYVSFRELLMFWNSNIRYFKSHDDWFWSCVITKTSAILSIKTLLSSLYLNRCVSSAPAVIYDQKSIHKLWHWSMHYRKLTSRYASCSVESF